MTKRLYLIDMDNLNMRLIHGLLTPAKQGEIDEQASAHLRQSWDNLIIANRNGQALLDAAKLAAAQMHRQDEQNDYFWDALDVLDEAITLCEKSTEKGTEVNNG